MHRGTSYLIACLMMLLLVQGGKAFTASPAAVEPGITNPGDPVNVSCTVYVASGTAFPSYDDLQFVTGLDDPVWTYTVIVNDVQNTRPDVRGKTMTIGGYELSYRNQDDVIVKIALHGQVPVTAATGENLSFLKIQELDARSNVIPYSVIDAGHLVGLPTPTPTPAYGSMAIISEPSGANVYLDNAIKGITPMTIDAVPNGRHTVLLRLDGYEDYTRDVAVMADVPQVNAALTARVTSTITAPSPGGPATTSGAAAATTQPALQEGTGSLSVTTSPPGALVYIDGQMKGVTPATIPGLSPGTHSIGLILDGYQDFTTTTEITAGTTSEFITGLPKRKQTPGFTAIGALAAVGLLLAAGVKRYKKT